MENTLSHFTILFSLFFVSACNTKPQGKLLNLDRNKVFREDETNLIGKDLGWTLTRYCKKYWLVRRNYCLGKNIYKRWRL